MSLQFDFVNTLFDNETTNPGKVTVAFTMGNKALEKGHTATVVLMVDAVHSSLPNKYDGVDIGAPFQPAKDLLEGFIAKGGKVLVCKSCLVHNGIAEDAIDERFEVITADDVIDLMVGAKGSLQIA